MNKEERRNKFMGQLTTLCSNYNTEEVTVALPVMLGVKLAEFADHQEDFDALISAINKVTLESFQMHFEQKQDECATGATIIQFKRKN